MKKRKLSLLIACAIATTSILSPLSFNSVSANTVEVIEMAEDKAEVSLIDLGYVNDKALTYTKYKNIKLNQNTDGLPIQLKLFGEAVQFEKGISAHAESSIVYDVEQYSKEFTHLRGYAGVDTRQASKGDGVIFIVYTSKDGQQWEEKFRSGVQKGQSECVILNVDITGAKYVKVFANHNTYNGNDHAVYGNLRLVDASKDVQRGMVINGVKTVAEYDALLKSKGEATQVAESEKKLVYQRELVNRVGYDALNDLYYRNPEYREAIDYFFNNEQALAYYIEAGLPDGGSQPQVLSNFAKIYNKYASEIKADQEYLLKLAVSIALSHSKTVAFWTGTAKPQDPVKRYESFKYLAENVMDLEGEGNAEHFKSLCSALMQFTVNARLHEDEVIWLAEYAMSKKDSFKDKNPLNAYNYITYTFDYKYNEAQYYDQTKKTDWDTEYNVSDFSDYGTKGIVRNFIVFEEGGVCGALAKTYATLNEVFGKPSQVVHQPGHAATISYDVNANGRAVWNLQNDVFGWAQSRDEMGQMPLTWGMQSWNSNRSASYVVLAQRNLDEYESYAKAVRLNIMADVYKEDKAKAEELYKKALEIQPRQLDSMFGLINTFKANETKDSKDYIALARQIVENFKHYPLAMVDLMRLIQGKVDVKDVPEFDLLKANALLEATTLTDDDVHQSHIAKAIANHILGTEKTDLATFSFDGKDANKIIINPSYKESEIMVKYSLDGGKTYINTAEHTIDISSKVSQITAENDILVGLVGSNDVFRIDIKETKAPTSATLYMNDLENRLIGNTTNLEISLDNGKNWSKYSEEMVIENDAIALARYIANGTNLQSPTVTYTFTKNTDTAERKYIPLKHLSLEKISSQQSNSRDHAGVNMIDGDINTAFHTTFQGEENKYAIIKLDKARYISAVEYQPANRNGRLRDVEIQVSMDNISWTPVKSASELGDNANLKVINLDNPVEAKYVKIVAKKTYGNSQTEQNKFFSGKEFYLYEDTTKQSGATTPAVQEEATEGIEGVKYITERTDLPGIGTVVFSRIDNGLKFKDPVTVYLIGLEENNMQIVNLDDTKYTFEENGTFTFEVKNKTTNKVEKVPVSVDWIYK